MDMPITPMIIVPEPKAELSKPIRSGPVLRERKIVSQMGPSPLNSGVYGQRRTVHAERKTTVDTMPKIVESPDKGPRGVWEPHIPEVEASPRPHDPRKVWSQTLPHAALQITADDNTIKTCESTGAPDYDNINSVCPPKSQYRIAMTNYWDPIMPGIEKCCQTIGAKGMSLATYPLPIISKSKVSFEAQGKSGAEAKEVDARGVYDPDDLTVASILIYRANGGPLPLESTLGNAKTVKIVPTDPKTKPISIGPPCNRREAMQSPWWGGYLEAEHTEMQSHMKNGTWVLHPRSKVPPGCPVLRDRWAYDDKLAPGGEVIERFKARLTAMGCFQKKDVDYTDTYASVMATRTFRFLLQLYVSDKDHKMEHWDVSTAFIHAPLKEQVWMKQATGHEVEGKESWVYLLVKALYGTKQAAHAWQQHLLKLLKEEGFVPLILDPATYVKREGKSFVVIGTHVDDLFVLFNPAGLRMKQKLWAYLGTKLTIKSLGEAKWTLQMLIQLDPKEGVLKLSQESFITEVLRRFNMANCKCVPTPAIESGEEAGMSEADLPVTAEAIAEIADLPFLEVIGCLWWLAQMTRLDIS